MNWYEALINIKRAIIFAIIVLIVVQASFLLATYLNLTTVGLIVIVIVFGAIGSSIGSMIALSRA